MCRTWAAVCRMTCKEGLNIDVCNCRPLMIAVGLARMWHEGEPVLLQRASGFMLTGTRFSSRRSTGWPARKREDGSSNVGTLLKCTASSITAVLPWTQSHISVYITL